MREDLVVHVPISEAERDFLKGHADKACIGGASQVRDDDDRTETLLTDNFVGQVAQYAGNKWLTGNSHSYRVARFYANLYPFRGDGGFDVPGLNVDFKGSLLRSNKPLIEFNLLVRPEERHKDWIYVLALVPQSMRQVSLMGWQTKCFRPLLKVAASSLALIGCQR